ncbi:MAG: hypothetical protein CL758_00955 [Chloroflexi bacterium]|nr:hypothetical protein [Chloroflexota bacterium]|tara:strand:+ start:501 stop:818 length:318 start_codon:yes stop_codon:yes gene_type:complete
MIYCFDIDGTICTNTDGDYLNAIPYPNIIKKVNELYNEGNEIILNTARGATTGIDWTKETQIQMKRWGVKYHKLLLGKPGADIYIDDKAINIKDWVQKNSINEKI